MRRDSALAERLVGALASRAPDLTGRRLEEWTRRGLGPLEGVGFDGQVEHFAALAANAGSGRSSDAVAIRMAARGFACRRLHSALFVVAGFPAVDAPVPVIDLSPGPSGDEGFAEVERIARELAATTEELPRPIRVIAEAMRRNALRAAWAFGEAGEDLFHSFLVNCVGALLGDEFYDATGLAAVVGAGSRDEFGDALAVFNTHLLLTMTDINDAYQGARLADMAATARILRDALPLALSWLGLKNMLDDDVDQLAVLLAPMVLALTNRMPGEILCDAAARPRHSAAAIAGFGSRPAAPATGPGSRWPARRGTRPLRRSLGVAP